MTLGTTVAKSNAVKVRKLNDDIVAGFAGGAADAVALLDKLESMLNQYPGIYSLSVGVVDHFSRTNQKSLW